MKKRLFGTVLIASLVLALYCGQKTTVAEEAISEAATETTGEFFSGELEGNITVSGKVFSFDGKSKYEYSASEVYDEAVFGQNTYGYFSLSGEIVSEGEKNGVPAYGIDGGDVSLFYTYGDSLLNRDETEWHLVSDKNKQIDEIKLKSEIGKGAVVLQTSQDGELWVDDVALTNAFKKTPVQMDPFYTTRGVQLINGCYYRVLVAYETGIKVGEKQVLFLKSDEQENKRYAELYEFYLYDINSDEQVDNTRSKSLGVLTKTGTNNGYNGSKQIGINDPHYGWEMGNFFISGYTRETKNDEGTPVFLKNVGDQITLWFNLKQNINKLNGKEDLAVVDDTKGYDQYFQTPKINMGKGTLIIRYTDEKGVRHDPEIYTNYLEANASTSADTIVKLFEEGDYEVALDYEIKSVPRKVAGIEVIPEYTNYRVFFKFAVRNGNCMVFPFDVVTKAELTNRAVTENGFYLDLARSRYLDITVKRSTVAEGIDGLTEDVRFNRPAKDGDEYTDPGLYSISVSNLYTGEKTVKEVFVGTDALLEEYLAQGVTMDDLME